MGLNATILITLSSGQDPLQTLELLREAGWRYGAYNTLSYLPLGDDDMFDWQSTSCEYPEEALLVCRRKVEQGELIGITLTWQETEIGGDFLLDLSGGVKVNLSVNRVRLPGGYNFTDFSWYLPKLISALRGGTSNIRSIECGDFW